MKKRLLIFTLLLMVLSGYCCAAKDWSFPSPGTFIPGETKYEQVIAVYGKPNDIESKTNDQGVFKDIAYTKSKGSLGGITPVRRLGFHFKDEVLIGYEFTSSYKDDSTDFDETKVNQIKKGETTWQKAVEIMGSNYGLYIYPLTSKPAERSLVYLYSQTKGSAFNLKVYTKTLVITYGANNIVSNISLDITGER
ncbi:MAG TPA: hypothetical protein VHY08_03065 [Bacillota bacterium]|nr:hypothetical protein [Bacillota bacterium]